MEFNFNSEQLGALSTVSKSEFSQKTWNKHSLSLAIGGKLCAYWICSLKSVLESNVSLFMVMNFVVVMWVYRNDSLWINLIFPSYLLGFHKMLHACIVRSLVDSIRTWEMHSIYGLWDPMHTIQNYVCSYKHEHVHLFASLNIPSVIKWKANKWKKVLDMHKMQSATEVPSQPDTICRCVKLFLYFSDVMPVIVVFVSAWMFYLYSVWLDKQGKYFEIIYGIISHE